MKRLKARLDDVSAQAKILDQDASPESRALMVGSAAAFRAPGPEILSACTEHLWAYYAHTVEEFTPEERADYGLPELSRHQDIWEQVHVDNAPTLRLGHGPFEPASTYLSFEGEVSWEPEHGLQLVIDEGIRVGKIGPYDDHVTNAHAFGDLELLGVIYR